MKRSVSNVDEDNLKTVLEAKKARTSSNPNSSHDTISFLNINEDTLNLILALFNEAKDIVSLGLTCSRFQNRLKQFWESKITAFVPIGHQRYNLKQKQYICSKLFNIELSLNSKAPFKLLDFSNLDPTAQENTEEFHGYHAQMLPWDNTKFVTVTREYLVVYSVDSLNPLFNKRLNASNFHYLSFCSKTRSFAVLVEFDSWHEILIFKDNEKQIVHFIGITVDNKKKKKKNRPNPISLGRGKPNVRPEPISDSESENEDEEGDEFNKRSEYQHLALGERFVTLARKKEIFQYTVDSGDLLRALEFSENAIIDQLNNMEHPYLEIIDVVISPDGTKAYSFSGQNYDNGPLYELNIETNTYRVAFHGEMYDKYPGMEFLNEGTHLMIESWGTNTSSWYLHQMNPPRLIGSCSEDTCGGLVVIAPDLSKCLLIQAGPVTVRTLRNDDDNDNENDENGDGDEGPTDISIDGDDGSIWTYKWHPSDCSIIFASSGGQVKVIKLREGASETLMTIDQPFAAPFWNFEWVGQDSDGNVLLLFVDVKCQPIVWKMTLPAEP